MLSARKSWYLHSPDNQIFQSLSIPFKLSMLLVVKNTVLCYIRDKKTNKDKNLIHWKIFGCHTNSSSQTVDINMCNIT